MDCPLKYRNWKRSRTVLPQSIQKRNVSLTTGHHWCVPTRMKQLSGVDLKSKEPMKQIASNCKHSWSASQVSAFFQLLGHFAGLSLSWLDKPPWALTKTLKTAEFRENSGLYEKPLSAIYWVLIWGYTARQFNVSKSEFLFQVYLKVVSKVFRKVKTLCPAACWSFQKKKQANYLELFWHVCFAI